MFCVIQEVPLKKPNKLGEFKKLSVKTVVSEGMKKYTYEYGGGRFERPIMKAYKISIHESKRINGMVTKKQYSVTTVEHYDLAQDIFFADVNFDRLVDIAEKLNTEVESLRTLVLRKLAPIQRRINADYEKTQEYKTRQKHLKILQKYESFKIKFSMEYGIESFWYDYCYDIYGKLRNKDLLDKIISERDEEERETQENAKPKRGRGRPKADVPALKGERVYRDFTDEDFDSFFDDMYKKSGIKFDRTGKNRKFTDEYFNDFYEDVNSKSSENSDKSEYKQYRSYSFSMGGKSYTNEEKATLRKFYKALAVKFHPDSNRNADTTKEMQFLNKLKDEWGI